MAKFLFNRKNSREIPKSMDGFSTDLIYEKRITSYEEKIVNNLSENQLLIKAKELYKKKSNGT
jgi:ATP-dependent exoDNAse (exonuclease V) alpha subunit